MNMTQKIRILLITQGNISEAELARRLGITPQKLSYKFKKNNFTIPELEAIASALDCTFETSFRVNSTGEIV
ncbi:MAG: helix-turn-helix transcriptional regulator [Oscillospiraceae bacterium]|nr:helix-turn-helix transcriptional regulator [Oscillospiraceae bacterium]